MDAVLSGDTLPDVPPATTSAAAAAVSSSASSGAANKNKNNNSKLSDVLDGDGRYRVVAFVSHMGSSAQSGHYVCHALRNGRWAVFNDR